MNLALGIMEDVFEFAECPYNLRYELKLELRKTHSFKYGIETASFIGARTWNSLPSDIKVCKLLEIFKLNISASKLPLQTLQNYRHQITYIMIIGQKNF